MFPASTDLNGSFPLPFRMLPVPMRRISLEGKRELEINWLLRPKRPVIVERGNALFRCDKGRAAFRL